MPTAWTPRGKPIWFTELGCPAVDKGPNQPNVFPDPKSAESALPYFSSGGRADVAQQRFLAAHAAYWDPEDDDFDDANNPVSPVYGGRMVDVSRFYVWAWDARPYPAFPLRGDRWSDHGNWHYGHWLNGRIGAPGIGDLINAILADHGLPPAVVDGADGTVQGYVIDDPTSARAALEPILDLFGLAALETADGLVFRGEGAQASAPIEIAEMVSDGRQAVVETVRTPDHQLPVEAVLSFRDPLAEYQAISVRHVALRSAGQPAADDRLSRHPGGRPGPRAARRLDAAGLERARAGELCGDAAAGRHRPGAIVRLPASGNASDFLVTEIEDGLVRKVSARQICASAPTPWQSSNPDAVPASPLVVGQPLALFLDLPAGVGSNAPLDQFRIAAWQKPWKSQAVFASPEETGFAQRTTLAQPADLGVLVDPLPPGVCGRIDHSSSVTVELFGGEAASVTRTQLLNGANSVAIRSASGAWEIVQFETAEEIAPDVWRLSGLLRGQLGTDDAMAAGADAGAHLVILDDAVQPAGLLAGEAGLVLNWRVGPAGSDLSGANFSDHTEIGGIRAQLPLSPVHLKAEMDAGGDLTLSWVRRGRIDADSWTPSEIPLGEEREEYQDRDRPCRRGGGPDGDRADVRLRLRQRGHRRRFRVAAGRDRRDGPAAEHRRRLGHPGNAALRPFMTSTNFNKQGTKMTETKPWYLSRTIWASLITIVTAAGGIFGVPLAGIDNSALTDTLLQAITAISGLVAIFGGWGRRAGSGELLAEPASYRLPITGRKLADTAFPLFIPRSAVMR